MTARITVERVLRDNDDDAGQSIRTWKIEAERGAVTIRLNHGDGFILLRPDDVEVFAADLRKAADSANAETAAMLEWQTR